MKPRPCKKCQIEPVRRPRQFCQYCMAERFGSAPPKPIERRETERGWETLGNGNLRRATQTSDDFTIYRHR